ncbi:Nonribosomal peptide synthetase 12 protein [Lasiodiplodia theobromae]|uniref:Nonribosomal peptide synthetase 12 protein n=1 Tax=Lasiodiplodia theobromae TaxID=45133 RepID=UPI0015C3A192|nr:Nonribosomal peptide synthetase 12 protein [Lasiodiplodia theobromae]KAF4545955.1 Nonribosomal peptide synthetase 12 protein [Lasiodiplodia theobromae]
MEPVFRGIENLSGQDKDLFNQFGRGQTIPRPFTLIHKAFEHFADIQPNQAAATHNGETITYGMLDCEANCLANLLVQQGLQPRQRVCVVVQRSIPMLIAILAVLKTGCQYIPIDGGVVTEQMLSHIFRDTQAPVILCLKKFEEKVKRMAAYDQQICVIDDAQPATSAERLDVAVDEKDGAYIIYTSGTTGMPKGVDVAHGNVTNTLCLAPANLQIGPGSRVCQVLNVSFDMAAWEILGCLMNGGTLVLRTSDWAACLREADTFIGTPSILGKYRKSDYPNLKTIAVGGERCPQSLADEWAVNTTFVNICGPTEITILNTAHIHTPGEELSIGKPIPNTTVYILDEDEQPVPVGEVGAMWVGGEGVSRGYLNLPDLTASRFKRDRFADDGSMMFNTGDLVRWRADGSLDILGRADDQVKVKGFRVELDGISSTIEKFSGIEKACTLLIDGALWGFYAARTEVDADAVVEHTQNFLPYYAVPSKWIAVPGMPLTANGKIDKRHLKELAAQRSPAQLPDTPPETPPESLRLADSKDPEKGVIVTATSRSSSSPSSLKEKEEDPFALPEKNGFHGERWLRHRFFSLYRRFFSIVWIANLIPVIVLASNYWKTNTLSLQSMTTATAANLTFAVLMRQEYVINLLFNLATAVPTSWPLCIRRQCARVFHIGGLHSGCAMMATAWFTAFTICATRYYAIHDPNVPISLAAIVVSYLVVALLLAMIVLAYPALRQKHHDSFELVHRFAGWTALALIWAQTVLTTASLRGSVPLGRALVTSPGFWLVVVITISIVLPWTRLRKVRVVPEKLSDHAIRLYFDYTDTVPGTAVRLSERPLVEWHAFATISEPGKRGFSLVVSNAGDWTKRQIDRCPTELYVRGIPACGVLRIAPLFKSVVLVATGSGIGPCLPVILAKRVPCRIFWSTPHPEKTFGEEIVRAVYDTDPQAVVHNTRTMGKPDMVAISYRLWKESGAEAVCIISNKKLTQKVVYGMEARGIPAYGAIFDS